MISQKNICGYCVETRDNGESHLLLRWFEINPAVFVYTLVEKYFRLGLECKDKWKSELEFSDKLQDSAFIDIFGPEIYTCGIDNIPDIWHTYGYISRWAAQDWGGFCKAFEALKMDSPELVRAAIPYLVHNEKTDGNEYCVWFEADRWNAEKGKPEYYGGGLIDVGPLENPVEFKEWLDRQDLIKWVFGECVEREKSILKVCKLIKLSEIDDVCKVGLRKIEGLDAAAPSLGLLAPSPAAPMVQESKSKKRKRTKIDGVIQYKMGEYVHNNPEATQKKLAEHFNISLSNFRPGTKLRKVVDAMKNAPEIHNGEEVLEELGTRVIKKKKC